jgi:hypothetical protein
MEKVPLLPKAFGIKEGWLKAGVVEYVIFFCINKCERLNQYYEIKDTDNPDTLSST